MADLRRTTKASDTGVTEIVPVADLARRTVAESAHLTGAHPVSVVTDPAAAATTVAADSRRIRQAIEALVSNAAQFSPSDAPIVIGLSSDPSFVEIARRVDLAHRCESGADRGC